MKRPHDENLVEVLRGPARRLYRGLSWTTMFLTAAALTGQPRPTAALDMVADIGQEVATEFGTYRPQLVGIVPAASSYTIAPDFSNVVNFDQFDFSETQRALLLQNGFVVVPSDFLEMYDVYEYAKDEDLPIFVTADSLLHTYHELFDYTLRTIETERFLFDLNALTTAMLAASQAQYAEATDGKVCRAAHRNVAYFALPARLLDSEFTLPEDVAATVAAELALIEEHTATTVSPIFGYLEDYSQYTPRGHYTPSEELKKYFRAMMWYGRMMFHCKESGYLGISQQDAREATRRALLLVQLIDRTTVDTEPALDVWERIYIPTTFYVGKTDDLTFDQYVPIARRVYGDNLGPLPADAFGDETRLSQFLGELAALPDPEIAPELGKGLKFMGQRYIPDSYMFTELVWPRTGRFFPRGLDVMAILGSVRAEDILDTVYDEMADGNYVKQLATLKTEFATLEDSAWAQNLYWNWLYCLMPLLAPKGSGFPVFMQTAAWADKELACALGSWAELRHDTILYAKQSGGATSVPTPRGGYRDAFVEPNPWAFARLASLTRLTMEGLANLGLLLGGFDDRLGELESLLLSLKEIAEKELTNRPLTIEEVRRIRTVGETLAHLTIFEPDLTQTSDDDMAVVADVHTNWDMGQCLEVGVGRPLTLFAIVGESDNLVVAMGSAFAYYEFRWPIADRLTDEAWREMLSGETPPALPEWVSSYIDLAADAPTRPPQNTASVPAGQGTTMTLSLDPLFPHPGDQVRIRVTLPREVTATLCLEAVCGDSRTVIDLVADETTPEPHDFVGILDTTGWPRQIVDVTVYSPDSLSLFSTDSFALGAMTAVPGRLWHLY